MEAPEPREADDGQIAPFVRAWLSATREAVDAGAPGEAAMRDLLLYCHGFCAALDDHHRSEDRTLFPEIEAAHPDLAPVLRKLQQDHSMMEHLIGGLRAAVAAPSPPDVLARHLEGLAAIMESHFGYEERQLLVVLETLALTSSADEALGGF